MVQEVEHKTAGKIKVTGLPVKFSETKSSIRLPPPVLGEHTFEVLKNFLGYSMERIEQLRRDKVCKFAVEWTLGVCYSRIFILPQALFFVCNFNFILKKKHYYCEFLSQEMSSQETINLQLVL